MTILDNFVQINNIVYPSLTNDNFHDVDVKIVDRLIYFRLTPSKDLFSYAIANQMGRVVLKGEVYDENQKIDLTSLKVGFYHIIIMRGLHRKIIPFKI